MQPLIQDRPIPAHGRVRFRDASRGEHTQAIPLVLDLDQTLLRSDLLFESMAAMVRVNPLSAFKLVVWAFRGRAYLKRRVAASVQLDPAILPINDEVAAFAVACKAAGQSVVVATAADEQAARRLMVRFPFVDEVIGSDGVRNLKGEAKARLLQMRYPQGFDYAGDSASDLPVWRASQGMILVEPSAAVAREAERIKQPVAHFLRPARLKIWIRALRIHQWAKNALVFAPLLLAGLANDAQAWLAAGLAFAGLSLTASATYIVNDFIDMPNDRKHRSKSARPLASGRLSLPGALGLCTVMLTAGLAVSAFAGLPILICVLLYLVATLAYSISLKRIPFLDTSTLAGLFTLRLVTGMVATAADPSTWLLAFSMFLFLSLSLAKRFVEVAAARGRGGLLAGRGYKSDDEPIIAAFGVSAAVASIVLFVLYLSNETAAASTFHIASILWLFPVLLFLWLSRIWILCARGEMDDDPVAFSLKDRVSLALGLASCALFAGAIGM